MNPSQFGLRLLVDPMTTLALTSTTTGRVLARIASFQSQSQETAFFTGTANDNNLLERQSCIWATVTVAPIVASN